MVEGLCFSSLGRTKRLILLAGLAFLASLVLGRTYLPSPAYFWGIGFGRLLLGLLLLLFPRSNAGLFRPILLIAAMLTLVIQLNSALQNFSWILVTALYLILEIAIDVLLFKNSTEQECPVDLGVLAAFRLLGLCCGLLLQLSPSLLYSDEKRISTIAAAVLFCFWLFVRESSKDNFLPTGLAKGEKSRKLVFYDAGHQLFQARTLAASLNLLAISVLSGLCVGAILPYPLLPPSLAADWLENLLPNLQLLAMGILVVWCLERFKLGSQLLTATILASALTVVQLVSPLSSKFEFLWGFLLVAILISGRCLLREAYRIDTTLKSLLLVSLWTFGSLLGSLVLSKIDSTTMLLARSTCIIGLFAYTAQNVKRFNTAGQILKEKSASQIGERFGDKKLDFEGADSPARKKRKWRLGRKLSNLLLVYLPVIMLFSALLSGALMVSWQVLDSKRTWQQRFDTATKVFKTELFLQSLGRRLNEEMIASQKVPDDWTHFIFTNFDTQGKSASDEDPWGNPYMFADEGDVIRMASAGSDGIFNSPDDLEQFVTKPPGTRR